MSTIFLFSVKFSCHLRWAILLSTLLICAQCAKVGRPPGGSVDRTPPTIVGHWPGSEQTEVPVDIEIFVEFSEKMDRRFTGSAIFVAPRTSLRLKWRGHRLEAHIGRLQPAQTYVVTVGADARDMRGNLLGASTRSSQNDQEG